MGMGMLSLKKTGSEGTWYKTLLTNYNCSETGIGLNNSEEKLFIQHLSTEA